MEGMLILGGLVVIIVFFILPNNGVIGPRDGFTRVTNPGTYQDYSASRSPATQGPTLTSAYSRAISIGQGNAAYSIEPAEEYITINNQSGSPINLTGWKLMNNKGGRTYYAGNQEVHYASDEVTIPQALAYIAPQGGFSLPQNIVLKPGEIAIVTTGLTAVQSPYKITSFKENICSGYLESMPQYDFTPALSNMCVPPRLEPGVENLDVACKNFISALSSCQNPTFGKIDRTSTDNCDNCVNGRPAPSSACLNFIKAHFSYDGCIDNHKNDAKFYGNTWRVFLGQKWDMWGKESEVISLFDQFGKLAAYKAY